MTVRELIQMLLEYDMEDKVLIHAPDDSELFDTVSVTTYDYKTIEIMGGEY